MLTRLSGFLTSINHCIINQCIVGLLDSCGLVWFNCVWGCLWISGFAVVCTSSSLENILMNESAFLLLILWVIWPPRWEHWKHSCKKNTHLYSWCWLTVAGCAGLTGTLDETEASLKQLSFSCIDTWRQTHFNNKKQTASLTLDQRRNLKLQNQHFLFYLLFVCVRDKGCKNQFWYLLNV